MVSALKRFHCIHIHFFKVNTLCSEDNPKEKIKYGKQIPPHKPGSAWAQEECGVCFVYLFVTNIVPNSNLVAVPCLRKGHLLSAPVGFNRRSEKCGQPWLPQPSRRTKKNCIWLPNWQNCRKDNMEGFYFFIYNINYWIQIQEKFTPPESNLPKK